MKRRVNGGHRDVTADPTRVREKFPILCMAQGFSLTAFAGSIPVAKDTVYEWIKVYP